MFRIILRTAYTACSGWIEEVTNTPEDMVRQKSDYVKEVINTSKTVAQSRCDMWVKYENMSRGIEIDWEKIENQELWVLRIGGKFVAADVDSCTICKKYRVCDYDEGRCSVLS